MCGNMTAGTGKRDGTGASTSPLSPLGVKRTEGGEGQSRLRRVDYVTINDGAEVCRGHCPWLENKKHHDLDIPHGLLSR